MLELAAEDDVQKAYEYMDATYYPAYSEYRDAVQKQIDMTRANATGMGRSVASSISTISVITVISLASVLVLSISTAFVIIRGTNKVLINAITSIDEGSAQVASASSQVSSASNMLAEGASEQAASLRRRVPRWRKCPP